MKLIYGTYNPSKLKWMKEIVKGMDIQIVGLKDLNMNIEEPVEDGQTPLENAVIKSKAYYSYINLPIFSCDSGLYFDGVSPEDQPGVHIKRIHGQNLEGYEFVRYYSEMAKKYGGKLSAYYKNAISLVLDNQTQYTFDGASICSNRFYIVDKPHDIYKEGFPLDSLSVDIKSNQYFYDLGTNKYENLELEEGFRTFFQSHLKNL